MKRIWLPSNTAAAGVVWSNAPQCWISGIAVALASESLNLISPGLCQLNLVTPTGTPAGDNPINSVYPSYPTFSGALINVSN
jgi:hypothetical protein